jgi:SET domain-containing protein
MPRSTDSKLDRPPVRGPNLDRHQDAAPLYVVRRSPIHGRGVFAARAIPKGTRIVEYTGRRIPYARASERYADDGGHPTHTLLFELDDDMVIDAGQGGNAARWINHRCDPNCEAVDEDGRIFIEAIRAIAPGEELGYDYRLTLDERHTPRVKRRWPCFCGAAACRGTLLDGKRPRSRLAPGASA